MSAVWGEFTGVTWENADEKTKAGFALTRLFWYFKMKELGGPDGSDLDGEVLEQARQAVEWFRPILMGRAESASGVRAELGLDSEGKIAEVSLVKTDRHVPGCDCRYDGTVECR